MNLETEIQWLRNLVNRLESLDNSSNPKYFVETIENYNKLLEKIGLAENEVTPQRRQDLLLQINRVKNKIRYPILSLMEYDFHENTHSNILEYLFSTNYGHEFGGRLLASFIEGLDEENSHNDIVEWILEGEYTIYREYHVGDGRIDLLIQDNTNRFIVLIENKTLSKVSESYDDKQKIFINQLNKYYQHFATNNAVFILLSYRNVTEKVHPKFKYADYAYLLEKLIEIESETDNILKEYILQLNAMLTPGFHYSKELLKLLTRLRNDADSIEKLGIYTIQLLKGYLNAIE